MTKLSHSFGADLPAFTPRTIGQALDDTVARFGDQEAVVAPWQDVRWTWRELARRVDALAGGLDALGLAPGDRVGILSPNCVEWVLTQLATARLGLILVAINPAYRTYELGHALRLSGVRALVTADRFRTSEYLGMLAELAPATAGHDAGPIFDPGLPDLRYVIQIDAPNRASRLSFADLAASQPATARIALKPADAINIQFTSGTTGSPKGATLSHANLLHNAQTTAAGMSLTAADRLCIPVPLYHCFGMVLGVLVCLVSGAAMVFPGQAFDAGTVLKTVRDERCTALHGVPTMFIGVLEHPDFETYDLSSLRTGVMAGAPCPPPVMRRVMEAMHMTEVTIGYGMTETSPLSTQTRPGADLETRTETVGHALPQVEARIVDEDGHVVPVGTPGEYCARGPGVMLGYWNQPEATKASIRDGWMHSGDLATMDEDGRVRIVGRIKDMIIRGGENIYPAEVEAFLVTHPAVADAAVFGVPDEKYGERVCAWVRLRDDTAPEAILDWCRGKITHHKIPSALRIVTEFPMTVTGKIQKFAMRDAEAEAVRG
ncbi:AMP-binding protein [Brevundimonas sp.]|uniref:AMP-binding protein n=1 Tax=Brevundimonas sp. TaxID=1871086 RepID=UPI003BA8F261